MPNCLASAGPLEIEFEFFDQTEIFLHHLGQFLSPNSRPRLSVKVGQFIKIAGTKINTNFINLISRNFLVSHEVVQLIPEFSNCVDSYDQNSNFDDCMYSNLFDLMVKKVGCTVPWLLNQSKICVDLEKRNQSFNLYQENRRNQENICPNSCKFSNMYFGPPVTSPIDEENKQNLGKLGDFT